MDIPNLRIQPNRAHNAMPTPIVNINHKSVRRRSITDVLRAMIFSHSSLFSVLNSEFITDLHKASRYVYPQKRIEPQVTVGIIGAFFGLQISYPASISAGQLQRH